MADNDGGLFGGGPVHDTDGDSTGGGSSAPATPKCPKGFAWSEQYKACIEVPKLGKCPPGYFWDPKKKVCISRETVAPKGFAWSEEFQTYIELPKQGRCPEGYYWDKAEKVCRQGKDPAFKLQKGQIGRAFGQESAAAAGNIEPGATGGAAQGSTGGIGQGEMVEPDPNQPLIDAGIRLYFDLWGQVPPAGYIEGLVKGGKSLFEIDFHERSKPEFAYSPVGKKVKADAEQTAAQTLGVF